MLRFHNYSKGYGKKPVIAIPGLTLDHGIYWLRGENGSGKTTLIKSIAGLIPFNGDIEASGTNIKKNRIAYTSIVNYAEAEPVYPEFLTGDDLISFVATAKKAPGNQSEKLAATLGISGYKGNKTGTYSSGMTKKLSLVLGFLGNPKIILLDEPLITLDVQSVAALQALILQSFSEGITFIITSHQEIVLGTAPVSRLLIADRSLVRI